MPPLKPNHYPTKADREKFLREQEELEKELEEDQKEFERGWEEYRAKNPNACMLEYLERSEENEPKVRGWCGTHR